MSNIEFDIKAMTINQEKLQALADEAKKLADRLCTKEGLIARQRHLLRSVIGFPIFFAKGEFEKARELVIAEAGREWENDFLRGFDLKLVSEQGAMLREGSVPMRACGPAAVFRWAAGELFADVAARGAAMVRDAVKEHLGPKFIAVHKERDRFAVYNDREARKSEIKASSTNHVTCDHAFRSDADARAATADLAEMALQFKRLKQAAHPGFSMGGTFAPDAAATDYYFGASSLRGVMPEHYEEAYPSQTVHNFNFLLTKTWQSKSETCAACGVDFSVGPLDRCSYTDGSGKAVPLCNGCFPKMTAAHKIIGGRIVETLPIPGEIRRGMVFWSNDYDMAPKRMFVAGRWDEDAKCWRDAREDDMGTNLKYSARHFLGCDPAHASPEDCERYGIAPGFEVKQ